MTTGWWTLCDSATPLSPRTSLLRERKSLPIFLTLLWVLHFIFVRFWWEGKRTEMFCNFFYVLLGFLLCCCCFVSEGRSGNHVLQEVELDGLSPTPQLLNLPLTVLSLGIKVWKCAQCNVYKTGWLRRHLLHGLFYMDIYMSSFSERTEANSMLVPLQSSAVKSAIHIKAINQSGNLLY